MSLEQFNELIECISNNQCEEVKRISSSNRNLMSMRTKDGSTPLIHACKCKTHLEIVQCLFHAGSQLLTKDNQKKTPFLAACESGNLEIAKFLYRNCNQKQRMRYVVDDCKEDPLTKSVKSGKVQLLKWLLQTQQRNVNKMRAIYVAVELGNVEMFKMLFKTAIYGLNCDDLMHHCVENPKVEIIKALCSKCQFLGAIDFKDLENRVKSNEVKEEFKKCYQQKRKEQTWKDVKPAFLIREKGKEPNANPILRGHPLVQLCGDTFNLVCSFIIEKPSTALYFSNEYYYMSTFLEDRKKWEQPILEHYEEDYSDDFYYDYDYDKYYNCND